MHFPAAVLATLIAAGAVSASDPSDELMWCQNNEQRLCLQPTLDAACYTCLHAVEASCPGDFGDPAFVDAMCHIPSDNWSRVKACLDDPATNCAKDRFGILHVYETVCYAKRESNRYYVCDKKNQENDPDLTQLAQLQFFDCDHNPGTSPSTPSSTTPAMSSTTLPGTVTITAPAHSSSAPAATNSVDCSTSVKPIPTKSGNSTVVPPTTVPVITAGAASNQVCMALAGLAALAVAF
ncbi:hypothetical protein PWT90_08284 [Aphanocladium album]|nr:hypothetical protein PWT90_08284 [Aphanocladium album]